MPRMRVSARRTLAERIEEGIRLDERDSRLLAMLAAKWGVSDERALKMIVTAAAVAAGLIGREVTRR